MVEQFALVVGYLVHHPDFLLRNGP
jgi:hypothetical protein